MFLFVNQVKSALVASSKRNPLLAKKINIFHISNHRGHGGYDNEDANTVKRKINKIDARKGGEKKDGEEGEEETYKKKA